MTWEQADQEPNRHNILLCCLKDLWVVGNSTCTSVPPFHMHGFEQLTGGLFIQWWCAAMHMRCSLTQGCCCMNGGIGLIGHDHEHTKLSKSSWSRTVKVAGSLKMHA